jgi:hypothetical protein
MADHPHTIDRWDDATGENLIEQIAAVGDYLVAARPASPAGRAGSWGYAARYLRIQRAVTATPGIMHFVPSLVPAAQDIDRVGIRRMHREPEGSQNLISPCPASPRVLRGDF